MRKIILSILTLSIVWTEITYAATATTTFNVLAAVAAACTITTPVTDLNFGPYVQSNPLPTDQTTVVNVTCTLLTPYNVGLNQGTGVGGTTSVRKMTRIGFTETLDYTLSQDAAHLINWGDTIPTDTENLAGTGLSVPHTVYGRIPAGQNVPAGNYSDVVTVTVTF